MNSNLQWKFCDKDYIATKGNFVFKLTYQEIGVYGMGKCYSLQVRRIDESEFKYLHHAFVVKSDGNATEDRHSVGGVLWKETSKILAKAEGILSDNMYL